MSETNLFSKILKKDDKITRLAKHCIKLEKTKKFSKKNIILNYIISDNIEKIKIYLENKNYNKTEFLKKMMKIIKIAEIEKFCLFLSLINLFNEINYEFGKNNEINFKSIINYSLKKMKNPGKVSFKLISHFNNYEKISKNDLKQIDINSLYFKSPIIYEKNKTKYIKIDEKSLITNLKTFKSQVKFCKFYPKKNIFLISLVGFCSILIFKSNCEFIKEIFPQKHFDIPLIILSIDFSDYYQRIFCLLNNNTISIWDFPILNYELVIKLPIKFQQQKLFFSKILNKVCTIEKDFIINTWDIENSKLIDKIEIKKKNNNNFEKIKFFKEILTLNIFLIATSNKELLVYDIKKKILSMDKKLKLKTINKVIFSLNYRCIILITHSNNIPILKLENKKNFYELNFIGKLIGHLNYVTIGAFIEKKGILITVDENIIIKFWNIKNMCCINTFQINGKSLIKEMVYINEINSLGLITKKINIYKLKNNHFKKEIFKDDEILNVFLDYIDKQLLVFTKKEILKIDVFSGKVKEIRKYDIVKKIEANYIKIINKGKNFYLGDKKGNIYLFNLNLDIKKTLKKHSKEIQKIFLINEKNFLTIGKNDFFVQVAIDNFYEKSILRKMKNIYKKKNLSIIEFNYKMNLLLLSNKKNKIFIIDFEFGKIYGVIKFEKIIKILDVKLFYDLGLIFIYLDNNCICLVEYVFDFFNVGLKAEFKVLDVFEIFEDCDLNKKNENKNEEKNNKNEKNIEIIKNENEKENEKNINYEKNIKNENEKNKIINNCVIREGKFIKNQNHEDFNYIISYKNGEIIICNLTKQILSIKKKEEYQKKNSFNKRRVFNGNFKIDKKNNIKKFEFKINSILKEKKKKKFF